MAAKKTTSPKRPARKKAQTLEQRLSSATDDSDDDDRMVERACASVADKAKEADEDLVGSPKETSAEWSSTPCVRDQMVKYPDTVRFGPKQTECLNLSVPAELKRYNEIQQGEAPEEAPKLFIFEAPKNFHGGQWLCLVTFANYEYQKL